MKHLPPERELEERFIRAGGPDGQHVNRTESFAAHDMVIDGSDNYTTRFLCGDVSVKLDILLV